MGRKTIRAVAMAWLGCAGLGCTSQPVARYVYQDRQYGVIGIPRNTPLGKTNYLEEARMLMTRHFPEGYEIVRAEEVVEGERTLDTAIKKELEGDPGFLALNQMLKVGKFARSSSLDQKDITHITESRIIYKRRDLDKPSTVPGFAASASLGPELYLDPNNMARHDVKDLLMAAKKVDKDAKSGAPKIEEKAKIDVEVKASTQVAGAPTSDPNVQQAAGEHPK